MRKAIQFSVAQTGGIRRTTFERNRIYFHINCQIPLISVKQNVLDSVYGRWQLTCYIPAESKSGAETRVPFLYLERGNTIETILEKKSSTCFVYSAQL